MLMVGAPNVRSAPPRPADRRVWGSGGLLDTVIRAARSAEAPLADLQVWVASETDLKLRDVTATLTP